MIHCRRLLCPIHGRGRAQRRYRARVQRQKNENHIEFFVHQVMLKHRAELQAKWDEFHRTDSGLLAWALQHNGKITIGGPTC